MKRYSFRLANVLRIRRTEEDRDRERLMTTNNRLRELIGARDRELARYEGIVQDKAGVSVSDFSADQLTMNLAARSLAQAQQRVAQCAAEAASAQVAWLAASRKVAIIERLDERRRLEHRELEHKAEVDLVDDLVTTRFVLGQLEEQDEHAS